MSTRINNVRWIYLNADGTNAGPSATAGWPYLVIDFEGRVAYIDWEQKLLRHNIDAVYLGPAYEEHYYVDVPEDREQGREARRVRGFTDDPEIVQLTKEFIAAVDAGTFAPQQITVDEDDTDD